MWNRSAWQSVGLALAVCPLAVVLLSGCGDDDGAAGLPATPTAAAATRSPTPVPLLIGAAKRDISPSLQTAPPDGAVWLGGYGIGRERRSTGLLAPIHVRAFVISDHDQTVVFAENETQGAFAAYKKDPVGLLDVAAAVETASGGRIPRQHVVVSSDHTHAGPDTTGVWGGLPASYLAFIRDQTVGAILDAVAAQKPAQLLTGTADASALLHSQYDAPPNDQVDGELRVLVAADPDVATRRQAVLINFAAHATVMGPGNLQISADWPGVVAEQVEAALGIDTAVVMVADVGRTQPSRPEDPGQSDPEKLTAYASDVTAKVLEATTNVTPATRGPIAATQLFLREPYDNAFFTLAVLRGIIARNNKAPWLDAGVIGTLVSAIRVGDLFFAAVPGEAYPAIQFALQARVPAARHFILGLANDQLGY